MTRSVPKRSAVSFVLACLFAAGLFSQDDCGSAVPIGNGLTSGSNAVATTGYPVGNCGFVQKDVWYRYVAACSGTATASLCSPGSATFDTVLTAWVGYGGCCTLKQIACNDDTCGLQSTVSFPVHAGGAYYLSVGGFQGATGSFVLSMACVSGAFVPPNDSCANPINLDENVPLAGTNVGATTGGPADPTGACGLTADVWYAFTASMSGTYELTTCFPATTFDTKVAVWTGGILPACFSSNSYACNDDSCVGPGGSLTSTVTFAAQASVYYRISVGGYAGAQGDFIVRVGPAAGMNFAFITGGIGAMGFQIIGGPPTGQYLAGITVNAGAYPNGWFFGVDIGLNELLSELAAPPFRGILGLCGEVRLGPYPNLPSGLTGYGVALGAPYYADVVQKVSVPASGTVP